MGILLYIYIYVLILLNVISEKKLKAVNGINNIHLLKKIHIRYSFFFNILNTAKKKINFFKKKNGICIFFKDTSLLNCFDILFNKPFSNEKKKFFLFNFFYFFYISSYFNHFFNYISKGTKNKKYNLFNFILILIVALKLKKKNHIYFINLNKIFDFFFFKHIIFAEKHKFIKIILNPINGYKTFKQKINISLIANNILKYNYKFNQNTNIKNSIEMPKFLFLLNSFFAKNKKFYFLRNNEIYNKSRYSRNRQTYKTGVFWCIWLTVLTVIGLYFYFYVFLIKFTYIWILFYIFLISFFLIYFRSKIERHFFF